MWEVLNIVLSLGLIPFLFILIWEVLKGIDIPPLHSPTAKAVITTIITIYGWVALLEGLLEPVMYMFGLMALMLIWTLLVAIVVSFIVRLRRRIRGHNSYEAKESAE